jgi:hypothetical protein
MCWTPGRLNALPSLLDIGYFSAGELNVSWADQVKLQCRAYLPDDVCWRKLVCWPFFPLAPILCSQKQEARVAVTSLACSVMSDARFDWR